MDASAFYGVSGKWLHFWVNYLSKVSLSDKFKLPIRLGRCVDDFEVGNRILCECNSKLLFSVFSRPHSWTLCPNL